jgi:hypothetical protein
MRWDAPAAHRLPAAPVPTRTDCGRAPLAARARSGADRDAANAQGQTPLDVARLGGHRGAAALLEEG